MNIKIAHWQKEGHELSSDLCDILDNIIHANYAIRSKLLVNKHICITVVDDNVIIVRHKDARARIYKRLHYPIPAMNPQIFLN